MEKWVQFARQNKYREFPPDAKHFSLYVTKLTEEGASYSTIKLLQSSMPFYYAARNSEALVVTRPSRHLPGVRDYTETDKF